MEAVNEHGSLKAEEKVIQSPTLPSFTGPYSACDAQAQSRRIEERETLIRSIGTKHHLKGYDHSPLEREKVVEFISRLGELQRQQNADTEQLQVRPL